MSIFSYHLIELPFPKAFSMMISPLKADKTAGLIYAETMSAMKLGSPVFSASRFFSREICVFAQWENENALNQFLADTQFGKILSQGWHVRMNFIRKWGNISGFEIPETDPESGNIPGTVVAVTLARMKYSEIPRFLHWGRPVEKLVRDHPGTMLSLASIRYPNLISTFSIWKSAAEMTAMVSGRSAVKNPKRHINAMKEMNRKGFHYEFTTLRFQPVAEHGEWKGISNYLSDLE